MVPETRYAKTADGVHIAYQEVGDGPLPGACPVPSSRSQARIAGWIDATFRLGLHPGRGHPYQAAEGIDALIPERVDDG